MEWFQEAWLSSSVDLGENRLRSGALMLAFLSRSAQFATGGYVDLLTSISRDALMAQFWDIVKNSSEKPSARLERAEEAAAPTGGTALAQFCVDFTGKAAAGEIDPGSGDPSDGGHPGQEAQKQSHRCG